MARGEVFGSALELMPHTSLGDTSIALQVKVLPSSLTSLSSGPRIHMVEGENQLLKLSSDLQMGCIAHVVMAHMDICVNTQNECK